MNAKGFYAFCESKQACTEGLAWIKGKSLEEFWATCERGDWMIWWMEAVGYKWRAVAWVECERIAAAAWAEYKRRRVPPAAWVECERITAAALRIIIPIPPAAKRAEGKSKGK
jgi:hypothetical protein